MKRLSGTALAVLGLLALRPRSGYEIKQTIDRSTRFFWNASYGQIYPELHRLAAAGLVEGEAAPRGGRARTVYAITAEGRRRLEEWLAEPDFRVDIRDEGLLKLFFADLLPGETALRLLRSRRAAHERILEQLRGIESGPPFVGGRAYPDLVLAYGIGFHTWAVGWCKELEKRLAREARRAGS
jgi:PadR family transcriptional regulator, regulatory protein AphA